MLSLNLLHVSSFNRVRMFSVGVHVQTQLAEKDNSVKQLEQVVQTLRVNVNQPLLFKLLHAVSTCCRVAYCILHVYPKWHRTTRMLYWGVQICILCPICFSTL